MAKYSPLTRSKYKFIYTFLGAIVGLAGIVMGTALVLQPQLLSEKAATVEYAINVPRCGSGLSCRAKAEGFVEGATICRANLLAYCCPKGEVIAGNKCVKACERGLDCRAYGPVRPEGSTRCTNSYGQDAYCCPLGQKMLDGRCTGIPSTPTAVPTRCDTPWVSGQCNVGQCGPGTRLQTRTVPTGCNVDTRRCFVDSSCGSALPSPGPCSNTGNTRCETYPNGYNTGRVQVCAGGMWRTSGCPSGRCSNGQCIVPVATPITGAGCFLAGTKVATVKGLKSIEDVAVSDSVMSFDDRRKVEASKVNDLYKVIRDHYFHLVTSGSSVDVTAEHPFYNGVGYTEAQYLKTGDKVFLLNGENLAETEVLSNTRINKTVEAYNLSVDTNNTFFANGFAVHNKTTGLLTAEAACKEKYGYGAYNKVGDRCGTGDVDLGSADAKYCPGNLTPFKATMCRYSGAFAETRKVQCCIYQPNLTTVTGRCSNVTVTVNTTLSAGSNLANELQQLVNNGLESGIDPSRFNPDDPASLIQHSTNTLTFTNLPCVKADGNSHCLNDMLKGIKDINGRQVTATSPKCDFSGAGKQDGRCCP